MILRIPACLSCYFVDFFLYFRHFSLSFPCFGWLFWWFWGFQLAFFLPRLTVLMILIIPACLFLASVDCFDDFEDFSLSFLLLRWLFSLFSTFQLVFFLLWLTVLMILRIPACLSCLISWLFFPFSRFQLAFLTYSGDWHLNFQFSSHFMSAFSMTVFNPLQKRYQKISLVQIDTKKSRNNSNRFIAENDIPLQQITFPCVYLNVTSSNFAHPKLLPGHRLLIMSQK